jgi:hypothetical protein
MLLSDGKVDGHLGLGPAVVRFDAAFTAPRPTAP